jgi:hypothetical protein
MTATVAVKCRPVIMTAESVRAILRGAKTQTRRVVTVPWAGSKRCQPYEPYWAVEDGKLLFDDGQWREVRCPYGQPSDRLWVREAFALNHSLHYAHNNGRGTGGILYRASCDPEPTGKYACVGDRRWRSPIHMPRWASRITLEITDVRVERLQDISEDDARAEGADPVPCEPASIVFGTYKARFRFRDGFRSAWDSINGKRASWDSNPWVWVLTFRRVEP